MDEIEHGRAETIGTVETARIATVCAPSTNHTVNLVIDPSRGEHALVGHLVVVEHEVGTATGRAVERGLGTVTEVTTRNRDAEQATGMWAGTGMLDTLIAGSPDWRGATVTVQAAFRRAVGDERWRPVGGTLATSPPSAARVGRVDDTLIDEIAAGRSGLHCLGYLAGPAGTGTLVRLPMNIPDFTGSGTAFHTALVGATGSGKTALAAYLLAGQMRHRQQGVIIIDPQGQFSHEHGLPFSLQAWAAELGRPVQVRRISEDLRLEADPAMLATLLAQTRFCGLILKMSQETAELLLDELARMLRGEPDWTDADPTDLLRRLLDGLGSDRVLARVYADPNRQDRLRQALEETDAEPDRFNDLLKLFAPLHNLFAPTNPAGQTRHPLWSALRDVFDRDPAGGGPAPVLICDMSTSGTGWLTRITADEDRAAALDALAVLDRDPVKATILRRLVSNLRRAAETVFATGRTLNTNVILDEAARYAPPVHAAANPQIAALSAELAEAARDTRKFGIGWTVITQSPRGIHSDIWDQTRVKFIGYGLGGPDLDRVAEHLDDRTHLRLYRAMAPPEASDPPVYPFMVLGPTSPLTVTRAPVFLSAHTDFDRFRDTNRHWIEPARRDLGAPVLSGPPRSTAGPRIRRNRARTREQARLVEQHAASGGTDPDHHSHLGTDPGFAVAGLTATARGPGAIPIDPDTGQPFPF